VTHGAVSRQIGALEGLLGVKLVERGTSLALTEEGQRLFAGVAPAFDRLAAAVDDIGRSDSRVALTINAPPTFTMKWLIPRLSSFQKQRADVDIRLSTGIGPTRELKMNEVDIVIRRLNQDHGEDHAHAFLSSELLAVCAPELLQKSPVTHAADICKHQLIEAATSVSGWSEWFDRAGHSLPADARFSRFEHMFFAMEAALDGLGMALLPSALIVDDLASGRLIIAWQVPGVYERDYFYILSPLSRRVPLAKVFCSWLAKQGEESNRFGRSVIQQS